MTTEEKELLNELLSRANGFRLALDCVLGEIEGLVGGEIDGLDEMVGNGIDADSLLDVYGDDEDETMDGDDEDDEETCSECGDPLDDGEGWDGLCGNCADRKENENPVCDCADRSWYGEDHDTACPVTIARNEKEEK